MTIRFIASAITILAVLTGGFAAPARAEGDAAALIEALQMRPVLGVMREEGLAYGADLATEWFGGPGGADWQRELDAIYDDDRLFAVFEQRFTSELAGADLGPMITFFTSDLGRRVTTLEISARRAMLDKTVDEAARVALEEAQAAGDPRLALIEDFIVAGDLVEANVASGLNSNLAFYKGVSEGGGMPYAISEDEMLADVWGQEPQIREDTRTWLLSYLNLSYKPLSDNDLMAYTEFSRTKPGVAMNLAMFAAFDEMFSDISSRLGSGAARRVAGQEL